MKTYKKQPLYYRGLKGQINEIDSKQLMREKIIWAWSSSDQLYLMCRNCGDRWWVQKINEDEIPIEYLRCMYCQNINYEVCALERELSKKSKTIKKQQKIINELKKHN